MKLEQQSKNQSDAVLQHKKKPNFLFIIVDEERYPLVYENEELTKWRKTHLKTQELLRNNGMCFSNHYIGSTACAPSRATLFTGQYPSLHGVTQTPGAAKGSFDDDLFWLDQNTVPTMGDYFRTANYRTFWKGKWHISEEDILIPGTHDSLLSYDPNTGIPDPTNTRSYARADRLEPYGFSGWIGPEPHGSDPRNSGSSAAMGVSGRDAIYAEEVVSLIDELEKGHTKESKPWLIVSSFVNPHDIVLLGLFTRWLPTFNFKIDPSVPIIPPAPTADECLQTKPTAQQSYRDTYQLALQPTFDTDFLRRFYFSLQKEVDNEMFKVFEALRNSIFYEDTIIVFTSDHGDLLGSHGGLFQKWHNAYEESLHVPLIIHSPKLFSGRQQTEMLTSHVDIIPTLLGLADISIDYAQDMLRRDHTEVHPLVGRDLTPLLKGKKKFSRAGEPLYFMTDDEFSKGLNQVTLTGKPYESVTQPNHLETVITTMKTGNNQSEEKWKLSRYYDNPQFWSDPGVKDQTTVTKGTFPISENSEAALTITTTKTEPAPTQYELYNVTTDPYEEKNLAHPQFATSETKFIQHTLLKILEKQSKQKRLSPTSGNVPGKR
ncbi:sulfatase-like hydrolase/transferase [Sporosarcina highlanderae]|uniref:Sulfatase-like hydrolase/transferase n=1 Tax=Sporosarcina highlanderae TaxID=3035916 RepID=A0ABT8JVD7_9BACL|nr:sulfatase-like hydrolase/transferase [Sporosarcina highlanderae]MDN4608342.1 sulfatase-like hydrolase/transferase [Sporosarcina highlanderae]